MNKKKFFATCTLVAFGATMVPALAFAGAGDASDVTPAIDAFTKANTGLIENLESGISVTFKGFEETWLDNDDKLVVTVYDSAQLPAKEIEDASAKFTFAVENKATAASAAGKIKIKGAEGATFVPGYYLVTMYDKTTNAPSDSVMINAPGTIVEPTYAPTVSDKGALDLHSKNLNEIEIAEATDTHVFELGDSGYAQIKAGSKEIGEITLNVLSVENLKSGYTYGLCDTAAAATDVYPAKYFTYDEVAKKVAKAVGAAQKELAADLTKVNSMSVEVSGTGPIVLTPTAKTGTSFKPGATAYIVGCDDTFKVDGKSIITPAAFDGTKITGGATIAAADIAKAKTLVKNGDVTGKVTVVIQQGTNYGNMRSEEATVELTLTSQKTDQEKMADFASKNGLTNYDSGVAADLTDDTAALTVTKVGEGITLPDANYTITNVSYNLSKYFNAKTGKVTKMPEKDVTDETVKLNFKEKAFDSGAAGDTVKGTITVALTIKADGSSQPSDDEKVKEAAKAVNDSVSDFATVYAKVSGAGSANGAAISDAEWTELQAAYLKVITAYTAYSALL